MQLAKFGHTGLTVSRLCRGTATFGKQADEPESHRILDVAADAAINFLDTAYFYPMGAAHAQTRVRKRLKQNAGADVGPDSAASGGSDRGAGAEVAAAHARRITTCAGTRSPEGRSFLPSGSISS